MKNLFIICLLSLQVKSAWPDLCLDANPDRVSSFTQGSEAIRTTIYPTERLVWLSERSCHFLGIIPNNFSSEEKARKAHNALMDKSEPTGFFDLKEDMKNTQAEADRSWVEGLLSLRGRLDHSQSRALTAEQEMTGPLAAVTLFDPFAQQSSSLSHPDTESSTDNHLAQTSVQETETHQERTGRRQRSAVARARRREKKRNTLAKKNSLLAAREACVRIQRELDRIPDNSRNSSKYYELERRLEEIRKFIDNINEYFPNPEPLGPIVSPLLPKQKPNGQRMALAPINSQPVMRAFAATPMAGAAYQSCGQPMMGVQAVYSTGVVDQNRQVVFVPSPAYYYGTASPYPSHGLPGATAKYRW
ncbi:MAG: hypothetical protein C0582_04905 [Alphaproteobacteria bacterium]|nr:MAG: hypothetical protein C0582_04905 [Alphaproteobacteria bacterium]